MKKPLGIYIHIPFCLKKCNYCDFCSFCGIDEDTRTKYIESLCRHIKKYKSVKETHTVDSIYFGGGTPTLMSVLDFEKIFETLHCVFDVNDICEITTECNPATADLEYFKALRKLGVNRLSLGVQSANDNELALLGRVHSWEDAKKAFVDARCAGFDNISADIMFGIPEQTQESLENTLNEILALSPSHISAYGLILEEGTPFFANRKKLVLPDEDTEYNMYAGICTALARHGLKRYEISNFSHPGMESYHNLKYWKRDEYLGFGASAHSFFDEARFFAPSSIDEYIADCHESEHSYINANDAACEYIMLGMRLEDGIIESEFEARFNKSFDAFCGKKFEAFVNSGFVVRNEGRCRFTDSGFYVSNSVLSEVLDFSEE